MKQISQHRLHRPRSACSAWQAHGGMRSPPLVNCMRPHSLKPWLHAYH